MPEVRPSLFGEASSGRVAVKVCGLTRLKDARLAWELGASALGFIFHPESPRFLHPEIARTLRAGLPAEARCIGVFVDASAEDIQQVRDFVGLSAVQLHGRESVRLQQQLRPALKVVQSFEEALASPADLVLVDASLPGVPGGTGLRADWGLAVRIARRRPLVLAGGLGPDTVLEALESVRPHALDVNSAVELAPGIKDSGRLRELFHLLECATSSVYKTVHHGDTEDTEK